jgi:membrane-associated protease RseP (regulator of RpoE activity)
VGCLLTAVNLLPIGQLDGGHVFSAMFPNQARVVARLLVPLAVVGAFFYLGWIVWAGMLLLLGANRPLPVPYEPPLPWRARLIALGVAVLLVLTFMPVPVEIETVAAPAATPP